MRTTYAAAPAVITITVASGTQTQTQAGYPSLSPTNALSVTKTGVGTLVYDAANTYTGTTLVQSGTLQISSGGSLASSPVSVPTGGTLKVDSGVTLQASSVSLSGGQLDAAGSTIVVSGTGGGIGQLAIASGTVSGSPGLAVSGSGQVSLPTATRQVVNLTTLSVDQATGGRIDIGKGRINVAAGGITEADLRADLIAGRSGGSFSGTSGIMTTGGTAGLSTQPVVGYRLLSSSSAIVAWAAFGDANLDGQVNFSDVTLINNAGKFGQGTSTGAVWVQGDFNYSGGVTFADITLLNNSGLYGTGSYLPPSSLGSIGGAPVVASVPEPGTWALAVAGLACAAWNMRRRWRRVPRRNDGKTVVG